jgi:transcriptional regulator GlxA family with amidase domain
MGFASKAFEVRRDGRGTTSPEVADRGRRACEGIADNHAIGHALANARISIVQPRAPHALGASEPNFLRSSYLDQAERDRNVVRRGVGIGTDLMRLLDQRFRLGPGEAGQRNVEGDFETKTDSVQSLNKKTIDTLIVPGAFSVDDVTRDRAMVQWIRRRAASCRRVCSVCTGSFLLAAAGVLNGRRAATHWMHAPLLATRHPRVRVEPDAIFVRDGAVWCSAGVTTGIDMALALIEEDAGRGVAMNVARVLVVYLKRAGGQSQFSALLTAKMESESEPFSELERWIAEHLKSDLTIDALAEHVHMSPRNFARAYAAKRGRTPAKAVEVIRVDAAQRRLEQSDDRIETVAEACGFSSEEQMRRAFLRVLKIAPREYRKRFSSIAMDEVSKVDARRHARPTPP